MMKYSNLDTLFITVYQPPNTEYGELKEDFAQVDSAIDIAQGNGDFENILVSGDFNLSNIVWIDGVIIIEAGICTQKEIVKSFMKNRFLPGHFIIPTRNKNFLYLRMYNVPECLE